MSRQAPDRLAFLFDLSWPWLTRQGLGWLFWPLLLLFLACEAIYFLWIPQSSTPAYIGLMVIAGVAALLPFRYRPMLGAAWRSLLEAWPFLAAFVVIALLTWLGAADPERHLVRAAVMAGYMISAIALFGAGRALRRIEPVWAWNAIPIVGFGVMAAMALLASDMALGGVMSLSNPFRPEGQAFEAYDYNRSATILTVMAFPVMLLCWRAGWRGMAIGAGLSLLALMVLTHSETARLIAMLGCVLLLLPERWVHWLAYGALAFMALFALAGPLVLPLLHDLPTDSFLLTWKPQTIAARLDIWMRTAELIGQNPLMGHGLDSMRVLGWVTRADGEAINMWHPHNAALQVVLDLGFGGLAWAMSGMLATTRHVFAIDRSPPGKPLTIPIIQVLAVFMVSHGLWNDWWWAFLALLAFMFAFVCPRQGGLGRQAMPQALPQA